VIHDCIGAELAGRLCCCRFPLLAIAKPLLIYSIVGRHSSAGLFKRTPYDDVVDERGRASLFALVRNAAHDVRTTES
jgi:hypothetical protein